MTLHELVHCLGFSQFVAAFKDQLVSETVTIGAKSTITTTFGGTITKTLNGGQKGPKVSFGHFSSDVKDPAGVVPRMLPGGGNFLSVLDLAVLKDIGYTVPILEGKTAAFCLPFPFEMGTLYSRSLSTMAQESNYNATGSIEGYCGN